MKRVVCYLLLAALFSCSKKSDQPDQPSLCEVATIAYSDPLTDGFGWTLTLSNGKIVVPENFDNSFKQEELSVNVCYTYTGEKAKCRCFNPPPIVHITNISLR
jgi:hypothetical protein